MRKFGFVLLYVGLAIVAFGYLLPTNKYYDAGVRFGQDCDGPFSVAILLFGGAVVSMLGFGLAVVRVLKQPTKRDRLALGVFVVAMAILIFKVPEIKRELDYNASDESSCSK